MGYFQVSRTCAHYDADWEAVATQIKQWPPVYQPGRDIAQRLDQYKLFQQPPDQGIEAKVLYVFTVARRLIRSAYQLAKVNGHRWNLIFIETSSLLFPMIELVGEARKVPRTQELGAGIRWLQTPENLPTGQDPIQDTTPVNSLANYMNAKGIPRVCDLYYLRNYYLHGPKNLKDSTVPIADLVNAELPYAITQQGEHAMRVYWQQLRQDDGTHGWIERLAAADIRPFAIQGSDIFDAGLVDPDIVDYLEDFNATVCN